MYILEFLLKKSLRIVIPAFFWAVVIFLPILLAQTGWLDFALIEGRCYRPLAKCGQDNISLYAVGIGILLAVPAVAATMTSAAWYDEGWVREREKLRGKYRPTAPKEPTRPDIYSD